jgi:hypothetical protein
METTDPRRTMTASAFALVFVPAALMISTLAFV